MARTGAAVLALPVPSGLPAGTVLDLPDSFTVGDWAAAVWRAADRLPRQIPDGDRWTPNPAHRHAHAAARAAFRTVCAHLDLPLAQVGPCASCGAFHHLYGPGGRPLCPRCHARALAGRHPAGRPRLTALPGGRQGTACPTRVFLDGGLAAAVAAQDALFDHAG